jgi:hypothetical protein
MGKPDGKGLHFLRLRQFLSDALSVNFLVTKNSEVIAENSPIA